MREFIKGFNYGHDGVRGGYRTEAAKQSRAAMFGNGVNFIQLAFPVFQKTFSSTEIYFDYRSTMTDADLRSAAVSAHKSGIAVAIRPLLCCADGSGRGSIDFPDYTVDGRDVYWQDWFDSYTALILHYAELAQSLGCEMLCIGSELTGTQRKTLYWRGLIAAVRGIYKGKLIYSCNYGSEEQVKWWDTLDYIGVCAYCEVGTEKTDGCGKILEPQNPQSSQASQASQASLDAAVDIMIRGWETVSRRLELVAKQHTRHVVFTEIGCRSIVGAARSPWDFVKDDAVYCEEEQAAYIDTCLAVMTRKAWFKGAFWWGWSTEIYSTKAEAQSDTSYDVHLKLAEKIIARWNTKI
ncbi:hypothetical protein FACS1894120_2580 [Clostridia bacterium]|nr:hypothetical protein FACS1894120_2580 [Clostridia bacterium]